MLSRRTLKVTVRSMRVSGCLACRLKTRIRPIPGIRPAKFPATKQSLARAFDRASSRTSVCCRGAGRSSSRALAHLDKAEVDDRPRFRIENQANGFVFTVLQPTP